MNLTIQPISYSGKRLDELGDAVLSALPHQVQSYTLAKTMWTIPDAISRQIRDGKIDYNFLLQTLSTLVDKSTLCILPVLTVDSRERVVYGGARDIGNGPAFVSTARNNVFGEIDTDNHIKAVMGVGLHEVGHVVGLIHHKKHAKNTSLGLCPMTIKHISKARRGAISNQQYVFAWSNPLFCDGCQNKLQTIEQRLKTQANP